MDKQIDVLIALGDCMVISEEYEAAMRDFNTALELHKKYYGENNRRTAEILYNIACCHRNIDDFKKAAEYFEEASKIITNILSKWFTFVMLFKNQLKYDATNKKINNKIFKGS